MLLPIKHIAAAIAVLSSLGSYRYYRHIFELTHHQHADKTWHDNATCIHLTSLSLIASPGQKTWLEPLINQFNRKNSQRVHVSISYAEDRDTLQNIINGKIRPTLWSAGATLWLKRLAETYPKSKAGQTIVSLSDPLSTHTYFRTPLVVLTTKKNAMVQREKASLPWDANSPVHFSHTNPTTSSSGFFALGLMASSFDHNKSIAKESNLFSYLQKSEKGLVYDDAAAGGTATLTQAFAKDPEHYGAILTWEGDAIRVAQHHPELVLTYPSPTFIADQSVALLQGDWVTSDQKDVARLLLDFLVTPESLAFGAKELGFRPVNASNRSTEDVSQGLTAEQGFQVTLPEEQNADYDAINAATYQWRRLRIAPAL